MVSGGIVLSPCKLSSKDPPLIVLLCETGFCFSSRSSLVAVSDPMRGSSCRRESDKKGVLTTLGGSRLPYDLTWVDPSPGDSPPRDSEMYPVLNFHSKRCSPRKGRGVTDFSYVIPRGRTKTYEERVAGYVDKIQSMATSSRTLLLEVRS